MERGHANNALLAAKVHEFRVAFQDLDAGRIDSDEFRSVINRMGIEETAEAKRLLSLGSISYTSLLKALSSGTPVHPDVPMGKPGRDFHPSQNTAVQSNVLYSSPSLGKARESRASLYATSPGLLTGGAVEPEAGAGSHVGYAGQPVSERRHKAREVGREQGKDTSADRPGLSPQWDRRVVQQTSPGAARAAALQRSQPGLLEWDEGVAARPADSGPAGTPGDTFRGSFSGRTLRSSRVSSLYGESVPDERDAVLPQGLAARAAQEGKDPREYVQRVKLHPSRLERGAAPWATDT